MVSLVSDKNPEGIQTAKTFYPTFSRTPLENPRSAFIDELRALGFKGAKGGPLGGIAELGRIVRIQAPSDKKGRESGWYWYSEFQCLDNGGDIGVGVYGSWKSDVEKTTWTSKRRDVMTLAEKSLLDEQISAQRYAREQELLAIQAESAERAGVIWAGASPASDSHPYLKAKGVQPCGIRESRSDLVIPIMDDGRIVSLQFIPPPPNSGHKKFLKGGKIATCYYPIGSVTETVYIAEGFATAASIHEATGSMVYVCFNSGNLLEVASRVKDSHTSSEIIICGDDDQWTPGNPGRSKATAAADVLRIKSVFPQFSDVTSKPTDFNDMAVMDGMDAVRDLLNAKPKVYEQSAKFHTMPEDLLDPPGILGDISGYYNATARSPQPGFAVQTALAIASTITARHFQTTKENFTSLFFLNVAKSGTGKEHCKTVIDKIMMAADCDFLSAGAGYTSAGAVYSTLLRSPKHITIIDEFGRYLGVSGNSKNTNLIEANTQLMEVIGRCHGITKPTMYSSMSLSNEKAEEMASRRTFNPAISMICMTTPTTLYKSLKSDSISDGFLGRFIFHQSSIPRMVHEDKDIIDVPSRITRWVKEIFERSKQTTGSNLSSVERPFIVTLPFESGALHVLDGFKREIVNLENNLERHNLDALPGRSKEFAMRISLIIALAENPQANAVKQSHMEWATAYMRFTLGQAVDIFKMHVSGSEHEGDKKEILQAIRDLGKNGISSTELGKTPPFSKFKKRDRQNILTELVESEMIVYENIPKDTPGRPRVAYIAIQ